MSILEDLLRDDLKEEDKRILVRTFFDGYFSEGFSKQGLARSKTLGSAKSLLEFVNIVAQVIDDYESRSGITTENKVSFTEEEPDVDGVNEVIVHSLVSRDPGAFQKGAPLEAKVRNLRPIVREVIADPDHPGYKQVVTGYWYDNVVRFTCWARTNKAANARADWFENLMEEYSWYFKLQGVDRVLFLNQQNDIVHVVNNNRWYGRPIDYFVRTEKLRVYNEKTMEEILLDIAIRR